MEEGAVLEILKAFVDLHVPYNAAIGGRRIDKLEPESMTDQIVCEDGSAL